MLKSNPTTTARKTMMNGSCARAARKLESAVHRKHELYQAIATLSLVVAQPSMALVDDRLSGDGTGKALGINDPVLGWVIISVFTAVWAVYYAATRELGCQREEDGLGL